MPTAKAAQDLPSPSSARHQRAVELLRARKVAIKALDRVDHAYPGSSERLAALEDCREALHRLLLTTLSSKMLAEFSATHPSLVQTSLFSVPRSPSE